jgi:hypothetical protein
LNILLGRCRRETSGQALVEFAIVTPLVVLVFLFAVWFYELVQIKLKVQEAGRYAAWEATAYPLHEYGEGEGEGEDPMQAIRTDTQNRYADLDSSTMNQTMLNRYFAAAFTAPVVIMADRQEAAIPGGMIVNFVFQIAAAVFDFFSALQYENANPVATSLIAFGRDYGGARMDRMFGNRQWGFNRNGYVCSSVTVGVLNTWFGRGVGQMIMPNQGVIISTTQLQNGRLFGDCVLADSWRLNHGDPVGEDGIRPGVSETAYWQQVDRMYFSNRRARGVADRWIRMFRDLSSAVLQVAGVQATPPYFGDQDWVQAAVVSRPYVGQDAEREGRINIHQDRGRTRDYDTSPVGLTGNAGESLREYGLSLQDRGPHFMGCPTMMQLGCPTATLQQDNPFGPYVHRGSGSGTGTGTGTGTGRGP